MIYWLPIIAALLLPGLLWGEYREQTRLKLCFKTPMSLLFVAVALFSPHPQPDYFTAILIGGVLGLVGDVCLALPQAKAFRLGVLAFLVGHLAYLAALLMVAPLKYWVGPGQLVILLISLGVYLWLRPHARQMPGQVAAYVVVITVMMAGAWAAYRNPDLGNAARYCIMLGAAAFYLSDILVARQRFVQPGLINHLISLPLYYAGQFSLAFSVGLV